MDNDMDIKRHGNYIKIKKGVTAIEGMDGNLPTLTIRKNGNVLNRFSGSSLMLSTPLTNEDVDFIGYLYEILDTDSNHGDT